MIDNDVRLFIYREFIAHGAPPSPADAALALRLDESDVAAAFQRLADAHVIVLRPGSREILMAAPLSAVPTRFRVTLANGHAYFANCIWDALGVAAMLHQDATIDARCGDCDEALALVVEKERLAESSGIVHFAVPAARWWEDIVFT
jgi:hypothetical protein